MTNLNKMELAKEIAKLLEKRGCTVGEADEILRYLTRISTCDSTVHFSDDRFSDAI